MASAGTVVIDPTTGRPLVIAKKDGSRGFEFRPMTPSELSQATQAFAKAADLEIGRAGSKFGATETEHRFHQPQ